MLKIMMSTLVVLASVTAQASVVTIENYTDKEVILGTYKGITLPSICEHTNYGFCWEEAFIRFKPISSKYKNIEGEVTYDLAKAKKAVYIQADESYPIEILGSCSKYAPDSLTYVDVVDTEVYFSKLQKRSVCFVSEDLRIIID